MVTFDHTIPPGGRGKIVLEVQTERLSGKIHKTARVKTNDPQRAEFHITVRGEVRPVFQLTPQAQLILTTPLGRPASQTLTLTNTLPEPVEIVGFEDNVGHGVEIKLDMVEKGRSYKLTMSTQAKEEALITRFLNLSLKNGPVPGIRVPIHVKVWIPKTQTGHSG